VGHPGFIFGDRVQIPGSHAAIRHTERLATSPAVLVDQCRSLPVSAATTAAVEAATTAEAAAMESAADVTFTPVESAGPSSDECVAATTRKGDRGTRCVL
jgi:hypothetical protein